ncbi:hypothetical protein CDG76_32090 [Nostoc sp. 'Peltigera membranacea cyanobiont' 210A]|uniref:hypothetical protein n=1 Tax=Nostoc sp. 'Peltigera membranacea cyanobiont' 210A TaxID=2014529 RepID=UPI000B95AA2E|nr:hypothetical protein [Nostoc sp. 'Peltigera membranacea cyanobiont' 210A]OYD90359.1 hypothetical protein CDG76_32090 [Nostoc sp. 'Peltigera membranacea cyanobiont' 210A]
MTLEQLQKQVLELPISDRWTLVQILLESLQQETNSELKKGNLSRLRGIAKGTEISTENVEVDYINYLTEKYQ